MTDKTTALRATESFGNGINGKVDAQTANLASFKSVASFRIADPISDEGICDLMQEMTIIEMRDFGIYKLVLGEHPMRGEICLVIAAITNASTIIQSGLSGRGANQETLASVT